MISFMKHKWLYFLISSIVLVPGIISLIFFGLKPSIDFTGGTLLELKVKSEKLKVNKEELIKIIEKNKVEVGSIQDSGKDTFLLRMKTIDKNKNLEIQKNITKKYGKVEEIRFETVGPTLGRELLNKTYMAAILASFAILFYVAWAFKNIKFGASAVFALIHDVLVVLGIFSILGVIWGVEIDSLFVTAVLTTMSFSVHDTIVVFDRIRELKKKNQNIPFEIITNKAITETMVRSLNNSLTIMFMLLALVLLGGQSIRLFTIALLIGTISGTYSSPFVATPILVLWQKFEEKKRNNK